MANFVGKLKNNIMRVKFLTLIVLSISTIYSFAQQGTIGNDELFQLRKSYDKNDLATRAITNALTHNSLKDLVVNLENEGKTDHLFKYKVKVSGITDQKSSGRCWAFASLNTLRPAVMEKLNVSSFEFSLNYLYFWDILEKSNLFLENVIATIDKPWDDRYVEWYFKSPVDDGGVWNLYVNLVQKYGCVPKSVMPETNSSNSTRQLTSIIKTKLREHGYNLREEFGGKKTDRKNIEKQKLTMLSDIYRILCFHLGEPPAEFTWRYETKDGEIKSFEKYTPLQFMQEILPDVKYDEYVMIMNDPTRPYYQYFEIENYRNTKEGVNWKYVNLPNDVIKQICVASIKGNESMYTSSDVGKQLNNKEGILSLDNYDYESIYGIPFGMDKKARIITRESGSAHAMTLIAVDVDENEKPTKWQFENSWGSSSGYNGYLTFTDAWFDEYMFRFVAHKKYLSADVLKVLEKKPIMLPPWDPMF
jgi:bleomycin hydrolase